MLDIKKKRVFTDEELIDILENKWYWIKITTLSLGESIVKERFRNTYNLGLEELNPLIEQLIKLGYLKKEGI